MHILAQHISCICNATELPEAIAQGYKEIYVMTVNGTFKHHILRGENRYIQVKVDKIPGYTEPVMKECMNFLPAGKIPYAIFEQVEAFFKKVMEIKTSEVEAMIHVLYNPEQGYHLGVPPQTVSKASASYEWDYIPQGTSVIVDIHSHNTMGAFFSGTDDRDDRNNISFSGVFGKLKDKEPMTIWRFNYFDKKFSASVDDVFEAPVRAAIEIPNEWLENVKTPAYQSNVYRGGLSNQGNVGRPVGQSPNSPASQNGRTLDQLSKWRYDPKNPTTHQGAGANPNSPANRSAVGPTTGVRPDLGFDQDFLDGCGDEFMHFFGHDATTGFPSSNPRGNVIPTGNGPDEEFVHDDRPDPNFGVTSTPEDFSHGEGEADPVGKSSGELALLDEANGSTDHGEVILDPEYEAICQIHGVEVADAWHSIATEMSTLDGHDELNQELICDMAGLSSDEGQLKIMQALFERLSPTNRAKIETYGL